VVEIVAYPDCKSCGGSGEYIDWVPYGDTYVPMYYTCEDCIERAIEDGLVAADEKYIVVLPYKES